MFYCFHVLFHLFLNKNFINNFDTRTTGQKVRFLKYENSIETTDKTLTNMLQNKTKQKQYSSKRNNTFRRYCTVLAVKYTHRYSTKSIVT